VTDCRCAACCSGADLFPSLAADANAGYDGVVINCFSGGGLMTVFSRALFPLVAAAARSDA
jgi:Asp/Glu/hydantoin racemase